ncbi:hypothetical protein LEP1GSC060_0245 [Leptospira weilii serovar Ranarum str. ICFT]|uniref:Uncharacterized protein n=1 Tax=Leptospira weilii serovar Ranarum str. ICFT TaxID=1218598 RepID=N1WH99_9LEPT|nr:hypothetical protein LEP1GSC060_0245 [Leptospira weilii serovar Ranarum str. ICFT]
MPSIITHSAVPFSFGVGYGTTRELKSTAPSQRQGETLSCKRRDPDAPKLSTAELTLFNVGSV